MTKLDENGLKKTPLYNYYLEHNYKLTDFFDWALPIQFTKIAEEHAAVRESVGIFECAHMGEILVSGENAVDFINQLITNDATKVKTHQAMYTAVTNEEGGTLDDLIFYKRSDTEFMFTPNASNTEKIYNWLMAHNQEQTVTIENLSDAYGLIAIQGPNAEAVLEKLTDTDLTEIKSYYYLPNQTVAGVQDVHISRTGYTGEDGFELYMAADKEEEIWKALLDAGAEFEIKECGLGARDTLRLEAGLALYGNDLSEDINPIEGGIGFVVKTGDKKEVDYPGKTALETHKNREKKRLSRGFELEGRGIARQGMAVKLADNTDIGVVTSGTMSPTFKMAIGMLLIDNDYGQIGNEVFIEIRNKLVPAKLVKKDWLRR